MQAFWAPELCGWSTASFQNWRCGLLVLRVCPGESTEVACLGRLHRSSTWNRSAELEAGLPASAYPACLGSSGRSRRSACRPRFVWIAWWPDLESEIGFGRSKFGIAFQVQAWHPKDITVHSTLNQEEWASSQECTAAFSLQREAIETFSWTEMASHYVRHG